MKTARIPAEISDPIKRRILAVSEDELQAGRSEIKPSEISPFAYREWCQNVGLDSDSMRG